MFDVMQSFSDEPLTKCEVCGAPVQRVYHPVSVHFKGSGFYNTDYGTKRRAREARRHKESVLELVLGRAAAARQTASGSEQRLVVGLNGSSKSESSSSSRARRQRPDPRPDRARWRGRLTRSRRSSRSSAAGPSTVRRRWLGISDVLRRCSSCRSPAACAAATSRRSPTRRTAASARAAPMSVWTALGASHEAQGRWMNACAENSWFLIPFMIRCCIFSRLMSV